MSEFLRPPQPDQKNLVEKYEGLLWQQAEELSKEREALQAEGNVLFDYVRVAKVEGKRIDIDEDLKKADKRYWEIQDELASVAEEENRVQQFLGRLEQNEVHETELKSYLGITEEKISKRRQRMQEQAEWYQKRGLLSVAGPEVATRLTTGRRLTAAKLNEPGFMAGATFNDLTVDTHGGKMRGFTNKRPEKRKK